MTPTNHTQQIITPARTGGRIGSNHPRTAPPTWAGLFAALVGVALFAAALGLIAGSLLR